MKNVKISQIMFILWAIAVLYFYAFLFILPKAAKILTNY